jgi:hypothetical protein
MTRIRIGLAVSTALLLGLGGLAVWSQTQSSDAVPAAESQALEMVGYDLAPQADPAPSTTGAATGGKSAKRGLRPFLRKHVLHGETVVQTKQGAVTIAVQRGTVTASDGKTVTVKSTDGFTQSWTLDAKITVRKDGKKADLKAVTVGTTIGIAGRKDGSTDTARLIVI